MKRILFITENANKYKEIVGYLEGMPDVYGGKIVVEMVKPDYELHEIQSMNRAEIVTCKLYDALRIITPKKHILPCLGMHSNVETWVMVEDTSLCIVKQGGFPGPFIKYYLQSLPLNVIANNNWGSEAQSHVNLGIGRISDNVNNDDGVYDFTVTKGFEGTVNGVICEPKGTNGFGFDPIFWPATSAKTNAEMNMDEKAFFNPRIRAFQMVLDYLMLSKQE